MPTNPFLSQKGYRPEQNLHDQLWREAIRFGGHDFFYIPRDIVSEDMIYGEDVASRFAEAYPIPMMIETVNQYEGQELFQKFGVEVRDEATLVVSKGEFENAIRATPHSTILRPREGDLIFAPISNSIFEIMFVEHEQPFYQLFNIPVYKLRIQLFEFANENFEINIEGLDIPSEKQQMSLEATGNVQKLTLNAIGAFILGENVTQSTSLYSVTGEIVKVEQNGLVIHVSNISTDETADNYTIFVDSDTIVSDVTSLTRTVVSVEWVHEEFGSNVDVDTAATDILDTSESNYFGYEP